MLSSVGVFVPAYVEGLTSDNLGFQQEEYTWQQLRFSPDVVGLVNTISQELTLMFDSFT